MKISVTTLESPDAKTLEVPNFVEWLKAQFAVRQSKNEALLWSPCVFKTGRKQADAIELSALALDFDNGADLSILQRAKLAHIVHTSYSHTPAHPKFRAIIALDRPVTPKEWPTLWGRAVEALGFRAAVDQSGRNVGRFYFVPSAPEVGRSWYSFQSFEGQPLPVGEFLEAFEQTEDLEALRKALLRASNVEHLASIRLAMAGRPIAQEGGRDNAVTSLGYYLGKFVAPSGCSASAVLQVVGRGLALPGVESKHYWETKFRESYEKGYASRQERQAEQKATLKLDAPWAKELMTRTSVSGDVALVNNTHNARTILTNEGTWKFRFNLMDDCAELLLKGEFRTLSDVDATNIGIWLQANFKLTLGTPQVHELVTAISHENEFDPVKTYLEKLEWDGVTLCDNFLVDYFGAEDSPITRLYSRKWLISLVARALRPGCKADGVLVLKGGQGLGKSTGLQRLVEPWFSDSRVEIGAKDGYQVLNSAWLHEFAELASMKRTDEATVKAVFTATQDTFRPSYGRSTVKRPRRCIFVATTNEEEFLSDQSGNRRYWVVNVIRPIDFDAITQVRERILAEAVHYFKAGEDWHLDAAGAKLQREDAQQYTQHPFTTKGEAIRQWWDRLPVSRRPEYISTSTVLLDCWGLTVDKATKGMEMEAGFILRQLGWTKHRARVDGRTYGYKPPVDWLKIPGLQEVKNGGA